MMMVQPMGGGGRGFRGRGGRGGRGGGYFYHPGPMVMMPMPGYGPPPNGYRGSSYRRGGGRGGRGRGGYDNGKPRQPARKQGYENSAKEEERATVTKIENTTDETTA